MKIIVSHSTQLCRIRSSTSHRLGILGIAPAFCTHKQAAVAANCRAASGVCALSKPTAKAAVKQSPAPVVSTTFAAVTAGWRRTPDSVHIIARFQHMLTNLIVPIIMLKVSRSSGSAQPSHHAVVWSPLYRASQEPVSHQTPSASWQLPPPHPPSQ